MTDFEQTLRRYAEAFPDVYLVGYDPVLYDRSMRWVEEYGRPYAANIIGLTALWFSSAAEPIRVEHMARGMFFGNLTGAFHHRRPETIVEAMLASSFGIQVKNVFEFFLAEEGVFNEMCHNCPASAERLREFRAIIERHVTEWNRVAENYERG